MDLADSWHFFLIFWFFSWSLARRNLNFGGFGLSRAAAEAAQKRVVPRPELLRGGGQNPQSLSFVLRAITKKNQNTQKKVLTTQPNPQYSAKNNVTIHMIGTVMPPPLSHITMCTVLDNTTFQQYLAKFKTIFSNYLLVNKLLPNMNASVINFLNDWSISQYSWLNSY